MVPSCKPQPNDFSASEPPHASPLLSAFFPKPCHHRPPPVLAEKEKRTNPFFWISGWKELKAPKLHHIIPSPSCVLPHHQRGTPVQHRPPAAAAQRRNNDLFLFPFLLELEVNQLHFLLLLFFSLEGSLFSSSLPGKLSCTAPTPRRHQFASGSKKLAGTLVWTISNSRRCHWLPSSQKGWIVTPQLLRGSPILELLQLQHTQPS